MSMLLRLPFFIFCALCSFSAIAQLPSNKLNQEDKQGKQGYWEFYDNANNIKECGYFKDNERTGTWKKHRYKFGDKYVIIYFEYSNGRKQATEKYCNTGTCSYTYSKRKGRWQLTGHYNGAW